MKSIFEIVELGEQRIIGTEIRTSNSEEQNEETAKIPAHWSGFRRQNPDCVSPIALYTDYESDYRGKYTHVIGVRADLPNVNDKNSKLFIVSAGKFLKFSGQGEFPEIVFQQWQKVWDYFSDETAQYQRNYQTDLEISNSFGAEIFIGVY